MKNSTKYIILSALILVGFCLIIIGTEIEQKAYPEYSYTVKRDNSYEVLLNKNDFFTSKTLPSGRYYPSKSIDKFIMNFRYDFINDKNVDLEYNYDITATLVGNVNPNEQKKEVWNRVFNLTENTNIVKKDANSFSINAPINIDYQYFNNLARSFEQNYNITLNSILQLRLNVAYTINSEDEIQDNVEVEIPVTNTVTNVDKKYQVESNENIINKNINYGLNKMICFILGGVLAISGIIILLIQVYKNRKRPGAVINRILKNYDYLIINVKNKPDIKNLQSFIINDYKNLINVAEQNKCNIICYQEKDKCNFYVIVDKYVYLLSMKK